ncbi:uncharacterized protein SPPG_08258 [Spizellomyces punctatus DAOM BR117]|uniref:Uncharacterized protein n=1 Tax=Spizellomyces punctatus (strain DAOM BR117) TaxID=645134 RepID=A0A0L0H6J8_SPIPD|nr:uncharacterized protein SPPG_08258 [Spizellomyces punctatus DAOM BR117]KNC96358.1 hypothetical protein SPPG_08258 [Spizellomyces punctatus DAOM BR117]|eukprot:XP_016604398.1 hypothetical protein SPPG_08258 [Spizellomyces punctatus DAOM BR117]
MSPPPDNSVAHSPSEKDSSSEQPSLSARDFAATSAVTDTPANNDPTGPSGEWQIVQNVAGRTSQENDSKSLDTAKTESATSSSQSTNVSPSAPSTSGPTEVGPETTTKTPVDRPLEAPSILLESRTITAEIEFDVDLERKTWYRSPAFGHPREEWRVTLDQDRKTEQVGCFLDAIIGSDEYEKRSVEFTLSWKLKSDREYLHSKKIEYSFGWRSTDDPGRGAPEWIPLSVFPANVIIKVDLAPKKIVDKDVKVEIRANPEAVEPEKVLTIAKSKLYAKGNLFSYMFESGGEAVDGCIFDESVNTFKISGYSVVAVEEMILHQREDAFAYMPKAYEMDELKERIRLARFFGARDWLSELVASFRQDHLNHKTVMEHLMFAVADGEEKWELSKEIYQELCMKYMDRYPSRYSTTGHFNRLLPVNLKPREALQLFELAFDYANIGLENTCLEFIDTNNLSREWRGSYAFANYGVMTLIPYIVERGLTTLMPECIEGLKHIEGEYTDREYWLEGFKYCKRFSGVAVVRNLSVAAQNNCPRLARILLKWAKENLQEFKKEKGFKDAVAGLPSAMVVELLA